MFNPKIENHIQQLAKKVEMSPLVLQQIFDCNHPMYNKRNYDRSLTYPGLYFHIVNLQQYLENRKNKRYPQLKFNDLLEATQTEEGRQRLKNYHTGYEFIRLNQESMESVAKWTEGTRIFKEQELTTVESRSMSK